MRIHQNIKIQRRNLSITNWKNHKQDLVEDFHNICGYCGKNFTATFCSSQIDHFIPQKKYPTYRNNYDNLVLSCKTCNNKKKQDWPSKDPLKPITDDGQKGYVDPATDDYDLHLERNEDGSINYKTSVGRYMYERLGFEYRPIKEIYKIGLLYERLQLLKKEENDDTSEQRELKLMLYEQLEELRLYIFLKKE